jgi:tripartite-type tricarboxylate transporter receptor subunit TctC
MEAMNIRFCILRALLVAIAFTLAAPTTAQTWPVRPVRLVVPFAAGGATDTVARLLAQKLTEQLDGSFVVENRPGSGGLVGAEFVARAVPDGYTLLVSAPEFTTNPSVRLKLPYDPFKDFAHITQLSAGQIILASHPSVPVKTVKELIALAKARPGELTYGHSGTGGVLHLAGELFQSMTGIRWVNVPFKGEAPAIGALMGGEVGFVFGSSIALAGPAKVGKVRAVAVAGSRRFAELPEVPTVAESGVPGYSVTTWYGLYAPAGTSSEILRRLHAETRRALNSPDVRERLAKLGNEPIVSSPEEFVAFLRAEIAKWTKVAREANIRID